MSALQTHATPCAFQVESSSSGKPLRDCVATAIADYFRQLDGHASCALYQMVLQEVEVPLLQGVLTHTGGNQTQAAELLGMNRGTLRKKLKQYGLDQ